MVENRLQVFKITLAVCLVCSVCVSVSAVLLRPLQQHNATIDRQRNILVAAGLIPADTDSATVQARFDEVDAKLVDIDSGRIVNAAQVGLDTGGDFDLKTLLDSDALSKPLSAAEDIAGISRRERYQQIYLTYNSRGDIERLILPVRGYGLWSTLYGFIALEGDGNTVTGLGFYRHGETPGLGGEVDNPRWKSLWPGKKIYRRNRYGTEVALSVIKGRADPASKVAAQHHIDGLSGATLTSRGVDNMLKYWLGQNGFGRFLTNFKRGNLGI